MAQYFPSKLQKFMIVLLHSFNIIIRLLSRNSLKQAHIPMNRTETYDSLKNLLDSVCTICCVVLVICLFVMLFAILCYFSISMERLIIRKNRIPIWWRFMVDLKFRAHKLNKKKNKNINDFVHFIFHSFRAMCTAECFICAVHRNFYSKST